MVNYKLHNIVLFTSALCNLQCNYCFIAKNKYLKDIDGELKESFTTPEYYLSLLDKLSNTYDLSSLESIGLWGSEPSFGYRYICPTLLAIITKYPSINRVTTSTNFTRESVVDDLLYMLNQIGKIKKSFTFQLQISIDGPPYITDINRGKGVTDSILKNYNILLTRISEIPDNIHLRISFKGTLTMDSLKSLCDKDNAIEYFKFFDDSLMAPGIKYQGENLAICEPYITMALPYDYTQDDGLKYAQWLQNCKEIDESHILNNIHALIPPNVKHHLSNIKHTKSYALCGGFCGACVSTLGLLPNYRINTCHRSFTSLCENYITEASQYDGKFITKKIFTANHHESLFDNHVDNIRKIIDTYSQYYQKNTTQISSLVIMIRTLAMIGQIDKKYKSEEGALMAAGFLTGLASQCAKNNHDITGTLSSVYTGFIKLYLNGAMDVYMEALNNG